MNEDLPTAEDVRATLKALGEFVELTSKAIADTAEMVIKLADRYIAALSPSPERDQLKLSYLNAVQRGDPMTRICPTCWSSFPVGDAHTCPQSITMPARNLGNVGIIATCNLCQQMIPMDRSHTCRDGQQSQPIKLEDSGA